MRYIYFVLNFILFLVNSIESASNQNICPKSKLSSSSCALKENAKRRVLILDVDNCLYSESEIKAATGGGIEWQIINKTHEFGEKELNLSKQECDEMYLSHGSTIEGIRYKLLSEGQSKEQILKVLEHYYHYVYDGIDMTCLLPLKDSSLVNTGYNHAMSRKRREVIRDMLHNMPYPIYFASNSPKKHVLRALSALGLKDIKYAGLLTPDTTGGDGRLEFPTKYNPEQFFHSLLEEYETNELILVDDSKNNLNKAEGIGIQGLRVNGDSMNLEEALSAFAGHIETTSLTREDVYEFSDVKYLRSKNEVDKIAISVKVWEELSVKLSRKLSDEVKHLRIVDVGSGLLSMLELVLIGGGGKEPLIKRTTQGQKLEYIAYESNGNLLKACLERLKTLGFRKIGGKGDDKEFIFTKAGKKNEIEVKVILRVKDFAEESLGKDEHPDLIIGCCFADLFQPNELVSAIARFTNYYDSDKNNDIIVYFPITFSGTTQFLPPKPFENNAGHVIPSDTMAFQLYAKSLEQQHMHNLDPTRIVEAMKDVGASLLTSSTSVWHIDPIENNYLWNTMLYFFGNSAAPQIMNRGSDSLGWVNRARKTRPTIRVMNQDLLFEFPAANTDAMNAFDIRGGRGGPATHEQIEEIEFQSPRKVGKKIKERVILGPNEVEGKKLQRSLHNADQMLLIYICLLSV